jgi:leader peptidase (prepilin peptidase) / N-methyltransferase
MVTPLLLVFVFGTIIGSFLNVIILRFHTGRGITGRSGCFSCGHSLTSLELIPIFSFLFQGGKCKHCNTKISWQYPVVEALTGIVFCAIFAVSGVTVLNVVTITSLIFLIDVITWSVLIVITVYDLKHMIIPDSMSVAFALLAVLRIIALKQSGISFYEQVLPYGIGALVLSGFFFVLWAISKGRWIGLGDSKLAFGMGLYLGITQGLSALAYAFWIGASVALLKMGYERVLLKKQNVTMKSEIPFAPFLILGTLLAFLFQTDVFHIQYFFS